MHLSCASFPLRSAIALLISLVVLLPARAFPQNLSPDFHELEKEAVEELKETGAPGTAVAVVIGEKVVFWKGFGEANLETHQPVDPAMLFRIGALTKMMTAAVVVMLSEEGRIQLDAPIGRYIKGLSPKLSRVTAHQLLTHTSGLRDESPPYMLQSDSTFEQAIKSWDNLFVSEPGQSFSHSSLGYWLAGYLIEAVTGKSYADQMNERLFIPLGMTSTTFRPTETTLHMIAQGHDSPTQGLPNVVRPALDHPGIWPSSSAFSSAKDLSRFAIAFLNGGKLEGKQVLTPTLIAKLSTPYAEIPRTNRRYGYGLITSEYRGIHVLRHGGTKIGYGSSIVMAPEYHLAVIILTNKSGVVFLQTAEKAFELTLPLAALPIQKTAVAMSESEMTGYVGVYGDQAEKAEIILKDGRLIFKQFGVRLTLTKIGRLLFSFSAPFSSQTEEVSLIRGTDGKIEYLRRGNRSYQRHPGN